MGTENLGLAEYRGSGEMLEDTGAHMAKGPGRPAKEFVPDAEGSQCSTRLEEPLLRNFGAPGGPPSVDRERWAGAGGTGLRCHCGRQGAQGRPKGWRARGCRSTGGGVCYANKRTGHQSGAGTAWAVAGRRTAVARYRSYGGNCKEGFALNVH